MKESKATQGEGYDFYDYRDLAFPAVGVVEAPYMVGFESNVAIEGAWPSESAIYPLTSALTAPIGPLPPGIANIAVADTTPFLGLPVGTPLILIDQANSQFVLLNALVAPPPAPLLVNVAFPAGIFVAYILANNAALLGPAYRAVDAQNTLFFASVACNIRLVSRTLFTRQLLLVVNPADPGGLPAGVPVQITIPAATWITLPDKWFILQAIAVGALPGVLIIKTSG